MAQITKKFIAANAIDGSKILILNNEAVRSRNNADSADIELLKLDTSDILQFLSHPRISTTASNDDDVLTLKDLNQELEGLKPKEACRVTTTVNIDVAVSPAAVDGITLVAGDRVLVKNQTAASENGIRVFSAVGAPLVRATDMDATSPVDEINGAYTFVQEGSIDNKGAGFVQSGAFAVLDTDDINFVFFNSAATISGGDGIDYSSNIISVDLSGTPYLEFDGGQLQAKVSADYASAAAGDVMDAADIKTKVDAVEVLAAGKQDPISGGDGVDVTSDVVSVDIASGETVTPIALTTSSGNANVTTSGTTSIAIGDTSFSSISALPSIDNGDTLQIYDNNSDLWKFTVGSVTIIVGSINMTGCTAITKNGLSSDFTAGSFAALSSVATGSILVSEVTGGGVGYLKIDTAQLDANVSSSYAAGVAGELMDSADIKTAVDAKQDPISGQDAIDVTSDVVSLTLDGSTLAQSASGAKIADGGVDELQLSGNVDAESLVVATGYVAAAGTVAVGDTIQAALQKVEGKVDDISVPVIESEIFTLIAGDITNGYIDLAATPLGGSILFAVSGAPSQIEGIDWSVSTNRITFLGDLASGGLAALEAGDILQVKYRS